VLSEPEFREAVKNALRAFHDESNLAVNPLLRSRAIIERAGAPPAATTARIEALRTLVREAADGLRGAPRTARGYHAVYHTYLDPAPNQEQAADHLDLPFSTYRRHLAAGIERITQHLWQREVGL
jgi:hypothetical protein